MPLVEEFETLWGTVEATLEVPAPFKTLLGWSLGSEEAADKERERIRRRRALEEHRWEEYFARSNLPTVPKSGADVNGAQQPAPAAPSRAAKLYAWLIGHGFRVYLKGGKMFVGPGPLSNKLRSAVIQHQAALRQIVETKEAKHEGPSNGQQGSNPQRRPEPAPGRGPAQASPQAHKQP